MPIYLADCIYSNVNHAMSFGENNRNSWINILNRALGEMDGLHIAINKIFTQRQERR